MATVEIDTKPPLYTIDIREGITDKPILFTERPLIPAVGDVLDIGGTFYRVTTRIWDMDTEEAKPFVTLRVAEDRSVSS